MSNQTVQYFTSLIRKSNILTKKEKEVLQERLHTRNLANIGKKYHVTAERIRQIEESAILKIIRKFSQLRLFD
jgi:DNA-directed RNA polymerase sigma subunit (sigma70/sigma32)